MQARAGSQRNFLVHDVKDRLRILFLFWVNVNETGLARAGLAWHRFAPPGDTAIENSFKWAESFSVGHDGLDAEHRVLVKAINNICEAFHARRPLSSVRALLQALEREAVKHLEHENAVMREIFASGGHRLADEVRAMTERAIEGHVAEHERNLRRLREIMRAASPGNADAAAHLCAELKRWFIDHAVKYDSHLKAIFQAM